MGIETRREREKTELKQGILSAALGLAAEEGWPKVTIRKIADQIEYSPPTIYEYFENKEAILIELRREGWRQKLAAVQTAQATAQQSTPNNPRAVIMAMVRAYWDFALNNRQLYGVTHGIGVSRLPEENVPEEQAIQQLSIEIFSAFLPHTDPTLLYNRVEIVVTILHGFVAMQLSGFTNDAAHTLSLLEQAINDLLTVWGRGE